MFRYTGCVNCLPAAAVHHRRTYTVIDSAMLQHHMGDFHCRFAVLTEQNRIHTNQSK